MPQEEVLARLAEQRIRRLRGVLGEDFLYWNTDGRWYVQHVTDNDCGHSCGNYWEMYRWCVKESEKRFNG